MARLVREGLLGVTFGERLEFTAREMATLKRAHAIIMAARELRGLEDDDTADLGYADAALYDAIELHGALLSTD